MFTSEDKDNQWKQLVLTTNNGGCVELLDEPDVFSGSPAH